MADDNASRAVRILLVEDDPSLAELLQEILTSEGSDFLNSMRTAMALFPD